MIVDADVVAVEEARDVRGLDLRLGVDRDGRIVGAMHPAEDFLQLRAAVDEEGFHFLLPRPLS